MELKDMNDDQKEMIVERLIDYRKSLEMKLKGMDETSDNYYQMKRTCENLNRKVTNIRRSMLDDSFLDDDTAEVLEGKQPPSIEPNPKMSPRDEYEYENHVVDYLIDVYSMDASTFITKYCA